MEDDLKKSIANLKNWTEETPPVCWQSAALIGAETDLIFWANDHNFLSCNIICNDIFFSGVDDQEISPIEAAHIYSRIKLMPSIEEKFEWIMEWIAIKRGIHVENN